MSDARNLLMGGSLPTVSLKTTGDRFDGVVYAIHEPYQSRTMGLNPEPAFWDAEKTQPKLVVPVEFVNDADGKNYLLHIGIGTDLQKVTGRAIVDAGRSMWEVGGHLSVAVVAMEPSTIKNGNDKKLHAAAYTPAPNRGQTTLSGGVPPTPASPPVAPAPAPVAAPPPPPVPVVPPSPSKPVVPAEWASAGWTQEQYDKHMAAQAVVAEPPAPPRAPDVPAGGMDLSALPDSARELIEQVIRERSGG